MGCVKGYGHGVYEWVDDTIDYLYDSYNRTQAKNRFKSACAKCTRNNYPLECGEKTCPINKVFDSLMIDFACRNTSVVEDFQGCAYA